jgi:hypothetical protein
MKGNIFSIEILISVVLVISIISIIYLQTPVETKNSFETIKLNSDKINIFYFGTNLTLINPNSNQICGEIIYYTDQNQIETKKVCEVVR